MRISGNTVLITGGATGIGLAMAEHFLSGGSTVVICGRRKEKLEEARKKHPALHVRVADLGDETERERLHEWAVVTFPDLNVLVNNAGIQRTIDLRNGTEGFRGRDDEIKINLEAPIFLSALFIPHLASKSNAAIVNISSGLGIVPIARFPIYCATKAAIHAYTLSLRVQLAKTGIRVYEVIPPAVDTELNAESRGTSRHHFGLSADEFVGAVMKELASDTKEIGYGMTEDIKKATREELDARFAAMNSTSDEQFSI
jgi:uncharacterized oxidoreductase